MFGDILVLCGNLVFGREICMSLIIPLLIIVAELSKHIFFNVLTSIRDLLKAQEHRTYLAID